MKTLQQLIDEENAIENAGLVAAKDAAYATLQAQYNALQTAFDAYKLAHPADTVAPSAPTNLVATAISSSQINVTWNASTDNTGGSGVFSYLVFRNNVQVGTTTSSVRTFSHTGLVADTNYSFSVKAKDAVGNTSATSAVVQKRTLAATTPPPALAWVKSADTGVRAGVTLTPYTGPFVIVTAGTVISGKIISDTLEIKADNVSIRDCKFQNFANWGILAEFNKNLIVEYCDIDGTGSTKTRFIGFGSGTVRFCDIKGLVIGIEYWGDDVGMVNDNYIHDLADTSTNPDDRHFDGVVCRAGSNLTILHNSIEVSDGTASTFITSQAGAINNILVQDNLLQGQASYTGYAISENGNPLTNVRYINNYIEKGIWPTDWTDKSAYILNTGELVESGNVKWCDGQEPVPAPVATWRAAA